MSSSSCRLTRRRAHLISVGVAVTDDFERWEVLSASVPDNRNMVLFPEKIGGQYVRY